MTLFVFIDKKCHEIKRGIQHNHEYLFITWQYPEGKAAQECFAAGNEDLGMTKALDRDMMSLSLAGE